MFFSQWNYCNNYYLYKWIYLINYINCCEYKFKLFDLVKMKWVHIKISDFWLEDLVSGHIRAVWDVKGFRVCKEMGVNAVWSVWLGGWHDLCLIRDGQHMKNPFKNVTGPNPAAKNKDSSWTLGEKANPACGLLLVFPFKGLRT